MAYNVQIPGDTKEAGILNLFLVKQRRQQHMNKQRLRDRVNGLAADSFLGRNWLI